jgi:hypothetical protein
MQRVGESGSYDLATLLEEAVGQGDRAGVGGQGSGRRAGVLVFGLPRRGPEAPLVARHSVPL